MLGQLQQAIQRRVNFQKLTCDAVKNTRLTNRSTCEWLIWTERLYMVASGGRGWLSER